MKRLFIILTLLLVFALAGCGGFQTCITDENGFCNGVVFTTTTTATEHDTTTKTTTTAELPRFRVKVVEVITGDDEGEVMYIVSKDGYTIGGIYALDSEQTFQLNDIIYVVITDNYTAVPFEEWWWRNNR